MKLLPEINCDLGEGISNEDIIFPLIDTASIACGGHFGDESTINQSIRLAKEYKSILSQIQKFEQQSEKAGLPMDHIKFHGALYNDAAANSDLADNLSDFIATHFYNTVLFIFPQSELEKNMIEKGLKYKIEVFGDRRYQDNYQLIPRNENGALMVTESEISDQLELLLSDGYVSTSSGKKLLVKADTICFHGDNPGIMDFLPSIKKRYWT